MTTKKLMSTVFLVSMLALTSCSKDDDNKTTPANPPDDGTKRVVWVDELIYYPAGEGNSHSSGDFFRYKFTWENGQLKRWSEYDIDDNLKWYYDFTYENGKLMALKPDNLHGESITTTLQYDGDRLTRAYESYNGSTRTYTYEYNAAGELVKRSLENSQSVEELTWENGNVVKVVDWYNGNIGDGIRTYSYDDRPNPLRTVYKDVALIGTFMYEYMSLNNVTEYRIQYDYDDDEKVIPYTLTYDGDYVTTQRIDYSNYVETKYIHYSDGTGSTPQLCNIKVSCNIPTDDRVVYGEGVYTAGSEVTIRASYAGEYEYLMHDGKLYRFECWSDGITDPVRTFTATTTATFQAIYKDIYPQ
ncbi:MAG: hypothetical protein J6I49_08720 [Bacteroidales bacterium]|nr:hypothetical protein [Bacteroidales bacterium]